METASKVFDDLVGDFSQKILNSLVKEDINHEIKSVFSTISDINFLYLKLLRDVAMLYSEGLSAEYLAYIIFERKEEAKIKEMISTGQKINIDNSLLLIAGYSSPLICSHLNIKEVELILPKGDAHKEFRRCMERERHKMQKVINAFLNLTKKQRK